MSKFQTKTIEYANSWAHANAAGRRIDVCFDIKEGMYYVAFDGVIAKFSDELNIEPTEISKNNEAGVKRDAHKIKLKILDDRLKNPETGLAYATPGSAAIDLRACVREAVCVNPGDVVMIPSGMALHIADPGLCATILPRSGLGSKHGIVVANLVGLIDSDYTGQIQICLWNRSFDRYYINPMDRVAQMLFLPVVQVDFDIVDDFVATERGAGGFGSSGVA